MDGKNKCYGEGILQLENGQEDGVLLSRHLSLLVLKHQLEDFLVVEGKTQRTQLPLSHLL